jgi:hypothetical protein
MLYIHFSLYYTTLYAGVFEIKIIMIEIIKNPNCIPKL